MRQIFGKWHSGAGQRRLETMLELIGPERVEAACKTVVGRRMKCTGMRWTVAGANPVLWVRCARLSGWFDDCWEHRRPPGAASQPNW